MSSRHCFTSDFRNDGNDCYKQPGSRNNQDQLNHKYIKEKRKHFDLKVPEVTCSWSSKINFDWATNCFINVAFIAHSSLVLGPDLLLLHMQELHGFIGSEWKHQPASGSH